ncbi:hypothetical protein EJB05_19606 [Eragrostis curvula]|uniref:Survival Motor Neuron Gemin2-binding domain-containing protein n=1 Tax=Eragrostis curvula TaxID=38414 RepID=A0A5J9UYD4_9POAL|nr:hypothetical protein EJB05_19606 [Eragrostis curvula]
MGKGGDLWDDSALVDAFDRAVATFKTMHGKNAQATPCQKEKPDPPAAEGEEKPVSAEAKDENSLFDDVRQPSTSCAFPKRKKDNSTDIPCDSTETLQQRSEESKTTEQAPIQETDPGKEVHVSESNKTLSSNLTDVDRNVSASQEGEHNELLRRYYELEEQSRNVLQQLQQTNYWDSQAPYYASTYQHPQVPAYSATAQDPHSSAAQSSCCYWNCPVVSVSCCSASQPSASSSGCSVSLTCRYDIVDFSGDQCPGASTTCPTGANFMQPPTNLPTNDDQVTKAAMMTAEGAFNFLRDTISGDPASQKKESETGKESPSIGVLPNFDITGADSDLAAVLNAWFAAGFYTGRYLAQQQSNKKSQQ